MSLLPTIGAIDQDTGFYNGVITSSCRLNGSNSRLASPAFGSDLGDTWTWSAWVKFNNQNTDKRGTLFGMAGNNASLYFDSSGQSFLSINDDGSVVRSTSRLLRDPSSWYHIVLNGNGTLNKLWINGVLATFGTNPNLGSINTAVVHYIGFSINSDYYFEGQIADINFVSETALDYTAFAEEKNGVLIPKEPSVTYGANGFRLQFKQTGSGADASGIGADTSGNNKHFTATNLNAYDVLPDSPENNFSTWNALFKGGEQSSSIYAESTLSNGNLEVSVPTNSYMGNTFRPTSGKWYAEFRLKTLGSSNGEVTWGWLVANTFSGNGSGNPPQTDLFSANWLGYSSTGNVLRLFDESSQLGSNITATVSAGDVLQLALDIDNNKGFIGINNAWAYSGNLSGGNPATGANPTFTFTDDEAQNLQWYVANGTSTDVYVANFGQDSTFGGDETATTNADANGIGAFHHAPPTGFLALCTANLEEPTIGPNSTAGNSTDFFDTVLYAGNDTANHVIPASGDTPELINFSPDWISVKTRSGNDNHSHFWITSSLGSGDYIKPDATGASSGSDFSVFADESTWAANTFRTGSGVTLINGSGTNHVAWLWKNNGGTKQTLSAGTNASVNTNQVNQTAGISFNNFTTSTRDGSDVVFKHGLGFAPDWIMLKGMESNNYIAVYSAAAGGTNVGLLGNDSNSGNVGDDIWVASSGYWGTIDDTNVTFQDNGNLASSGEEVFAWCFAAKEGFSKFGTYTGNGDADGTFVYTGFRPAFIMIKSTTVAGQYWVIKDTRRDPVNPATNSLYWNTSDGEGTGILLDILSNGFKPRTDGNNHNNEGGTYAYMAFAEVPFKYALAR
jgi:hypothetical protein